MGTILLGEMPNYLVDFTWVCEFLEVTNSLSNQDCRHCLSFIFLQQLCLHIDFFGVHVHKMFMLKLLEGRCL